MQMSSRSEELHKSNAFNRDSILSTSSETTVLDSPIAACNSKDDLYDESDRYCKYDLKTGIDLSNELDTHHEDNTDAVEVANDVVGPSRTIGVDELIVATIHTWNTKDLKSKMTDSSLFTAHRQYKILGSVSLCNLDEKIWPHNPPRGYVAITEDILHYGVQFLFLPYFQKLLNYYGISPMQLTPNSYR